MVAHRPRHALLAEAVAGGLLPGERAVLHERTARALAGGRGRSCWPRRWPATGRPRAARLRNCSARMAAAAAAERVFGYAEAAVHWQRAIELCQAAWCR